MPVHSNIIPSRLVGGQEIVDAVVLLAHGIIERDLPGSSEEDGLDKAGGHEMPEFRLGWFRGAVRSLFGRAAHDPADGFFQRRDHDLCHHGSIDHTVAGTRRDRQEADFAGGPAFPRFHNRTGYGPVSPAVSRVMPPSAWRRGCH
jgi:hypothetical protein